MEPEDVTLKLLREITDDFSEERKLGEGAFGVVYKGLTKNGEYVAVKKLRNNGTHLDHYKQFQNELDSLMKLKHQNIVRLFGYCYQIEQKPMDFNGTKVRGEETHRALCLEYLRKGSLQKYLSDESSGLDWHTRYEIIKGICEGLKHIHEELDEPIYHLDLKPANILLDENMVPKLADFGLSRIFGEELTRTTKSPLGTLGYQPPEYIERDEISKKFDIFSLGVVMIQIVSGSEGYEKCANMPSQEFVDLVKINWRNRLRKEKRSDSLLEEYCQQVEACTQIALKCVEKEIQKRPDMVKITNKLNQIEIDRGRGPQKSQVRMETNDTTLNRSNEVEFDDIRETSLEVGEEFIVGRTTEKMKIMAFLLQSNELITILPIYGIGGIGKTTFAKLIYNDTKFKDYSRVWVYVSPRFDVNKVSKSINSQLLKERQNNDTQMIDTSYITKMLSGKKILIVLDDLWEDNIFQLEKLKRELSFGGNINTIVLVTTRSEHVAKNISTNIEAYKIESLTNDMCWDIIKQKSGFEDRNDKEHLADVGREIAVKCGGVALAAQSLGFMLQSMEYDQWMEVKDSDIWNESKDGTLPNHVLASLKLSCTKMGSCLMSCFTYCAIFPKGHQIVKENLVYQWISLGLIKPTILRSSMQVGEDYIVQLLGLSFFQHSETSQKSRAYKKGLTLFTMHDLVHDLARSLAVGEVLDDSNTGGRGYRYAWLTYWRTPLKSLTDSPEMIKAIHGFSREAISINVLAKAFLSAERLQVLDLGGCRINDLPASIGTLVELRYLNATRVRGQKLPCSFTKLSKLIYLNLSGSEISALPDSIGEIKGLMHLDMSYCQNMCELPESFVNLKTLVHLDLSHCSVRITARRYNSGTSNNILKSLQEVICNLTELQYLGLSIGYTSDEALISFINHICTLTNLVHLDLSGSDGLVSVPERIGSLSNLHTLDLSGCSSLVRLPKCMRKMDSLKFLDVTGCPHLDKATLPRSVHCVLPHFTVHADSFETSSNIDLLRHENPKVLYISRLENVMSAEEVRRIKLSQKQAVKSLSLEWTRDARRSVEDVQVLGQLVPPVALNSLVLRGYQGVSFPTWVIGINLYLPDLAVVVLCELPTCNSLPPLGQLPNLRVLVMEGMDSITTIEESFSAGQRAFLQLKKFHLRRMGNLELWNTTTYSYGGQEFMFPNLTDLLICDCPKLRLRPCPPYAMRLKIKNCMEAEIDHAALFPSWEPGPSCRPYSLKVKSCEVPLEQWMLFQLLLPTSNSPEIIRELSYIESLYLEGNAEPQLPKWLGELTSLQMLRITKYPGIDDAPLESLKQLTCLRYLWLSNCGSMSTLPQWLGELISLQKLIISDWINLSYFPGSLRRLTSLQVLRLEECPGITALPEWLGELISLSKLIIVNCRNLSDFPESMRRLTSLQKLRLEGCPRITALPEWLADSIQKLTKLRLELIIYAPKLARWCALAGNKKKLAHIEYTIIYRFNKKYEEKKIEDDSFSIKDQTDFYHACIWRMRT